MNSKANKNLFTGIMVVSLLILVAGIATYVMQSRDSEQIVQNEPSTSAELQQYEVGDSQVRITTKRGPDSDITDLDSEMRKKLDQSNEYVEQILGDRGLDELMLVDPDTVEKLLEEYGTLANLYAALSDEKRLQLIDYMLLTNQMRDNLEELLAMEENSDIRAFMISRVFPSGSANVQNNLFGTKDMELVGILDKPTETPIGSNEWIARMKLANLVDQEYALKWAQDASLAHPDDPHVMARAATLTLKIGSSVDNVSASDIREAEDYLRNNLPVGQGQEITADERVSAYYALYFSEDRGNTLDFFNEIVQTETDQRAQGVLNELIGLLER